MKRLWKLFSLLVGLVILVTACVPSASAPAAEESGAGETTTDAQTPITVWIDTTRQAAVDAYKKANPDKAALIQEVIVNRDARQSHHDMCVQYVNTRTAVGNGRGTADG